MLPGLTKGDPIPMPLGTGWTSAVQEDDLLLSSALPGWESAASLMQSSSDEANDDAASFTAIPILSLGRLGEGRVLCLNAEGRLGIPLSLLNATEDRFPTNAVFWLADRLDLADDEAGY